MRIQVIIVLQIFIFIATQLNKKNQKMTTLLAQICTLAHLFFVFYQKKKLSI